MMNNDDYNVLMLAPRDLVANSRNETPILDISLSDLKIASYDKMTKSCVTIFMDTLGHIKYLKRRYLNDNFLRRRCCDIATITFDLVLISDEIGDVNLCISELLAISRNTNKRVIARIVPSVTGKAINKLSMVEIYNHINNLYDNNLILTTNGEITFNHEND